jgi:5-methylcytosine-specific restriction endonuclease McrA
MICPVCTTEFHRPPMAGMPRKYCGDKCKERARPKTDKRKEDRRRINREWRSRGMRSDESHAKILAGQRTRRSRNREQYVAYNQIRRAKERGNGGSYSIAEWKALLDATGHRCLCCGRGDVKLTVDHVIPVSLGGASDIGNLQPLCLRCNSAKHNRTLDFRTMRDPHFAKEPPNGQKAG